jgi:medium-chain acyl-[acyl-carrier-protein] hydrolase
MRLFCFPYAGGSAAIYRRWHEEFPPDVEVCAIQLPGRGGRLQETLQTSLGPLVEKLAPAIVDYLDKPFAFFGHSMGALIGFELARRLRAAQDVRPAHLFISGRSAPQLENRTAPIHDLPEAELLEKLRELNGTPREVLENPELMRLMLPMLRADFSLCETYAYSRQRPLECPITAFGGWHDREVSRESLSKWSEQTEAAFVLRMLPGDHFFLNAYRPLLVETISRELYQNVAYA